jgi:hypothetical protein
VGSDWFAVLKLFRNIGWDKLGTSSGENYWKLTAFRGNPDHGRDNTHTKEPENMDILYGCLVAPYLKAADHFQLMEFEKSSVKISQLFDQTSIGPGPMTIYI